MNGVEGVVFLATPFYKKQNPGTLLCVATTVLAVLGLDRLERKFVMLGR